MFVKFRKTFNFFIPYISESISSSIRVFLATLIDICTITIKIVGPLHVATNYNVETPLKIIVILGGSLILSEILPKFRDHLLAPVVTKVQRRITQDIHQKCFNIDLTTFINTPTGNFAKIIGSNYTSVSDFIPVLFGRVAPFIIELLGITIALVLKLIVLLLLT